MRCPVCPQESLAVLELNGVEIDWCAGCGGVWLDRGELELLHGDAAAPDLSAMAPEPSAGPRVLGCPECGARMKPVRAGWPGAPVLDQCPKRDGMWFDAGELQTVLKASGGPGGVAEHLKQIFKPGGSPAND